MQQAAEFSRTGIIFLLFLMWIGVTACNAPASEVNRDASDDLTYDVGITVEPDPAERTVRVELRVRQTRSLLRELRMEAPAGLFAEFSGQGDIAVDNATLTWNPPPQGGTISWVAKVNRERDDGEYDAYMSDSWALLRGSDFFPPATTRTIKGASGDTTLRFRLPSGWSAVTEYAKTDGHFVVSNDDRRFDRPTGWMLLGHVGTRTEKMAGTRVTIAAPKNEDVRRLDMLALLRWTMPEVQRIFPEVPQRITVFSAAEPMWRGGLSAPASVYIHASRPLISENGTSTLLHEIVHVVMRMSARPGSDWIVEGLAEYYGLQLLLRSGTISARRYESSIESMRKWGKEARSLCVENAGGAVKARAVALLHDLDEELRAKGAKSLDDVMRVLVQSPKKIETADLIKSAESALDAQSRVLRQASVAACLE